MHDLFQGLDGIDWAGLSHAYGAATDVPDLLRALTAADPATREGALDALYGGVHHQGDVYDSTLACLPFLCAIAAEPGGADRDGVLRLIDSIGHSAATGAELGAEEGITDPHAVIAEAKAEDEWYEEVGLAHGMLAHRLLAELLPPLTGLLADQDPDVRGAATELLANRHQQPGAVLDALLARAAEEPDGAVRHALAQAIGTLAGRLDAADAASAERAGAALLVLAEPGGDPGTELAALAELARNHPQLLPADTAERATAALDRARERPAEPAPEPRPDTPTLLSHLRELRAESFAEGADQRTAEALERLHAALGDRVELRHELVLHTLRHGDPNGPRRAVDRAGTLHTGWRTSPDRAAATAELLGALLTDPDQELAARAAGVLRAGRLPCDPQVLETAAVIMEEGQYHGRWGWERNLPGECMQLLANHGDERAVRELSRVLPGRPVPEDLALWCERLRPHSAKLLLTLVRRCQAAGEQVDANQEDGGTDHDGLRTLGRLIAAMAACGPSAAHMTIGALLAVLLEQGRERDGKLHIGPQLGLSRAHGLGPEPGDALPVLRDLLTDPEPGTRVLAARALFHGGQDAAEYLPVLARVVEDADQWQARYAALELTAALGPAAAPLGELLRGQFDRALGAGGSDNELVRLLLAARAATPVTPADDRLLGELWQRRRDLRPMLAEALLREAGALPEGFAELLREELAHPRRHNNDGAERGLTSFVRYDCEADDTLLRQCEELLA
ncbi:HEAT repeat domain-containing protein [Kitasatospora viridis]|uniref:HEAT repeat protein n=1 Tax=Kitasatospora viridis TaxID=281105 RepID=A0A561TTQ4_9ACTN|nr:HEAT repeat domain-containing protein [Kitasatospora viridis]TWF90478.1 HEAT repeat protein [Kitasatospora viridis]